MKRKVIVTYQKLWVVRLFQSSDGVNFLKVDIAPFRDLDSRCHRSIVRGRFSGTWFRMELTKERVELRRVPK